MLPLNKSRTEEVPVFGTKNIFSLKGYLMQRNYATYILIIFTALGALYNQTPDFKVCFTVYINCEAPLHIPV